MAHLREIVIDSAKPSKLARFWADALDGYEVRRYDDAEVQRLASLGLTPETDPGVAVEGPGPILWFQQVEEPARARNRIHFDVVGIPRAEEVSRPLALGAIIRDEHDGYTVMLDPEGNQFCVQDPR